MVQTTLIRRTKRDEMFNMSLWANKTCVLPWPESAASASLYSTPSPVLPWLRFKICYKHLGEPEPTLEISWTLFPFEVVSNIPCQTRPPFTSPSATLSGFMNVPLSQNVELLNVSIFLPQDYDILSQIILYLLGVEVGRGTGPLAYTL